MPELFEPLRSLTDEPVQVPPAAEVRRRGDRIRRRRTALQTVGAACLVAALGAGAVTFADQDTRGSAPAGPATHAPTPAATAIPRSFPLAAGIDSNRSATGPELGVLTDLQICDADASLADTMTDEDAVRVTEPGASRARDLTLYADPAAAHRMVADLAGKYEACPRFTLDNGASYTVNDVRTGDLGDESWTVVRTYESGGQPQLGQQVVHLVRVGSAVLVSVTGSEDGPGATDPSALDADVADDTSALEGVVDAMCVFTADGC